MRLHLVSVSALAMILSLVGVGGAQQIQGPYSEIQGPFSVQRLPPVDRVERLPLAPPSVASIFDDETGDKQDGKKDGKQDGKKDAAEKESKEVAKLTKQVESLSKAVEKMQDAEAKKKADAAKKPTQKWTGRIHADHWSFSNSSPGVGFFEHDDPGEANFGDDPEDRWAFRRLRLGLQGDVLDTMLYKLEVDFNNPSEPEFKDIYIGWKELPHNQTFLIGNQKRPLGLDHLNSSRYNVFMERPFVVESFNEDARRVGAAMYGSSDDLRYNWRYGVYNLENMSGDGRYVGDSLQLSGNCRLASCPWYDETSDGRGYFHWAVSGMLARPDGDATDADTNANEARFRTRAEARPDTRWFNTNRIATAQWYEILGLESVLNLGPVQVVGEYQWNWTQREVGRDLQFSGAYVYLSYFLTGEHMPFERDSGTLSRVQPFENFFLVDTCSGDTGLGLGAWQVALRYSYIDLSDDNVLGGVGNSLTLGLNWYWTAYSKIQTNFIYGDIDQHEPVGGYSGGNYTIIGARYMADF